uniref:Uncharacterized protein n=1 Tax=Kalanchoe fedtschenkoi TaxID=63787 RepID=A0A7N0ZSR7_KALFE
MDARSRRSCRSARYTATIRLGRGCETDSRTRMSCWSRLWARLVGKERLPRRGSMLFKSGSVHAQPSYDEYSYSLNFDEGRPVADDHDCLSRSFSARFSDSSRTIVWSCKSHVQNSLKFL